MNEQELREKIVKKLNIIQDYGYVCRIDGTSGTCHNVSNESVADALIAAGIGDVSEWKHKAEVAERALKRELEIYADNTCPYNENSKKCKECEEKMLCSTEYATQCYFELAIQQAEKELQEELEYGNE